MANDALILNHNKYYTYLFTKTRKMALVLFSSGLNQRLARVGSSVVNFTGREALVVAVLSDSANPSLNASNFLTVKDDLILNPFSESSARDRSKTYPTCYVIFNG